MYFHDLSRDAVLPDKAFVRDMFCVIASGFWSSTVHSSVGLWHAEVTITGNTDINLSACNFSF